MTRLVFSPVGGGVVVAIVIVLLAGLLVWFQARGRLTARRRGVLFALRGAVLFLLLTALLRPTIVYTTIQRQSAVFAVLLDRSRSMAVTDSVAGRSRWQELRRTIDEARPALDELATNFELQVFTFGEDLSPVAVDAEPLDLPQAPDARQTAIGAALDDIVQRSAGKRVGAVILLSDGAQRAYPPRDQLPQSEARRLADLGAPLYTIAFGQPRGLGQSRDLAVRDLLVAQTVFVKNRLLAEGAVAVEGFADQDVSIDLLFENPQGEMEIVGSQQVRARQDGQRLPIALDYAPSVPGEYKLTLRAASKPGELVTTNNELSTFVTVLAGGLNVLYLEGAYRAEGKFLRRALDASPDINLDYVHIDAQDPRTRPADMADRLTPGKYDVYILGDLDSTAFEEGELGALAELVNRGAGLIMLGGLHSFGPGGYGRTPLSNVLPIEIDRTERQNFDEPIVPDLHLAGETPMRPTAPVGVGHPILSLAAPERNQELWRELPALEGANRFRLPAPGGLVLAESPSGAPLLVAKNYGGGRVLAFAGDSTWRWAMQGFDTAHKRFWRQIVLWLARKEQSGEDNVWVRVNPRRYEPGSRVEFTAGGESPAGEPLDDVEFTAEIITPDGERKPVRLSLDDQHWSGQFIETLAAGDYTLVARAARAGQTVGEARARFLVTEQDLELDNPAADPAMLDALAAMTGGKKLAPEQLPDLVAELEARTRDLEVETETKRTLWDTWPLFLTFVALLCLEWYLRKRWGLV